MMGGRGVMNHQVLTNESPWQESGQTVIVPCREQGCMTGEGASQVKACQDEMKPISGAVHF